MMRRVPSRESVTRTSLLPLAVGDRRLAGAKAAWVAVSMWDTTRPTLLPVFASHTPTRSRRPPCSSPAAMSRPSWDQQRGGPWASLSSRTVLPVATSRMRTVEEWWNSTPPEPSWTVQSRRAAQRFPSGLKTAREPVVLDSPPLPPLLLEDEPSEAWPGMLAVSIQCCEGWLVDA